jgi:hypothetical protein
MVALIGPLAINICEPRQARKGATVAVTLCAGVWLVRVATNSYYYLLVSYQAPRILVMIAR